MFGWLGGFGVDGENTDDFHKAWILTDSPTYRYPISKTADGTQQILYSPDMSSWTTRRISQRVVSEDADRMVIEATAPSGTKGFFKVVGGGDTTGIIVKVQAGALPPTSEFAGASVSTFKIDRTELTWSEWQAVRDWAVLNGYADLADVGAGTADNHPVRSINWYDAVKWCNARSEKEGLTPVYLVNGQVYRAGQTIPQVRIAADGYRLPMRAEWEWAARGGVLSKGFIYSGSNDLDSVGWYTSNSGGGTKPVGIKAPNELGLHDMTGNLWEWCFEADSSTSGAHHLCGGSWVTSADACVITWPGTYPSSWRETHIGLRVARNAED